MTLIQIAPSVYQIPLRIVNAFLIDHDGLTLVDTGIAGSEEKILQAVRDLGRQPTDVKHILVTHCHGDHTGSLAALKRLTGAPAYMHPVDAALVRQGKAGRPMRPGQGLVGMVFALLSRLLPQRITATEIEYEVNDGDELPIAGGMRAIHVPGHCAGQLAFLWPQHGGLLFAADACLNGRAGLKLSIAYEQIEEGRRGLAKLAALKFDAAGFGHGRAIKHGASHRFRERWGAPTAARRGELPHHLG